MKYATFHQSIYLSLENKLALPYLRKVGIFQQSIVDNNNYNNNNNNNNKVTFTTVVKGDPKAPFSIATTPRCRGGPYSFPQIAPLYP